MSAEGAADVGFDLLLFLQATDDVKHRIQPYINNKCFNVYTCLKVEQ